MVIPALICGIVYTSCVQTHKEIEQYVSFLKKEKTTAKDYVLSLFEKNDIVILCERDHRELTQYELILEIMRDPYFIDNVGVVFTEVGARTINPELNDFLWDGNLTEKEVAEKALHIQRNCVFAIWEKSNFSFFIKGIHSINKSLPTNKKAKMYPTDVMYVEGEPTEEKVLDMILNRMEYRDSLMADFIAEKFNGMKKDNPRQKALVIMNHRHAYKEKTSDGRDVTGMFLVRKYPGEVANVLINPYDVVRGGQALQSGKWDAAFKAVKIEDAGFDFRGSPFGNDRFDYCFDEIDRNYADMFDGFVFYQPIEKFQMAVGLPGFMEDGFFEEVLKEVTMFYKVVCGLRKVDVPPADEVEGHLRYYNDMHITPVENLEEIKDSIDKWLN
jgi:archaellum component FlaF (FlaF/FlaG flagellin family)